MTDAKNLDVSRAEAPRRKRFERAAAWVVVTLPAAALLLAVSPFGPGAPTAVDSALLLTFYALTMLGLTAGFHRLFTHRSFAARPAVRVALAIAGSMALEGPIVRWVAQHRRHHAHADGLGDPHSPVPARDGVLARLRGLWHAHAGWMLQHERTFARRYAPDLIADPVVRALDRLYLLWVLLSLGLPAAAGAVATGTGTGAWSGLLWGGFVRIFLVHHVSWAVNSVGHSVGARPYPARDRSTNNLLLALLTFGEGWHNNHHAFPSSARHGQRWWQLDLTWYLISALARLGLVSAVKRPRGLALVDGAGRISR